jgi:hypothetical protein
MSDSEKIGTVAALLSSFGLSLFLLIGWEYESFVTFWQGVLMTLGIMDVILFSWLGTYVVLSRMFGKQTKFYIEL